LNATNIIFKAEKALSYQYLHDLSNGAKFGAILCRNGQANDTAKALSIVIDIIMEKQNHFGARAGS
jgi:hypothetical protein